MTRSRRPQTDEVFQKLRENVQLVPVVTPSKSYENMFLESVVRVGNAGTGTGRTFRLGFKEIRKVRVSIVAAPVPTEIRAQPMKKKGAQGPIEVPPAKKASTLKAGGRAVIDAIRGR